MEANDTLILLSLTQTEINAITSPDTGGMLYNSTTNTVQTYSGTVWENSTITDTDDIPEGSVNLYYTDVRVATNAAVALNTAKNNYPSADATKVGHLTVTQAVDLDTLESDVSTNNAKNTNATHTGEMTGSGALTANSTIISNKAAVTAASGMEILVNDSGTLKKADASDFLSAGSGLDALETATLDGGNIITPSQLSSDADDYNPTGFSTSNMIRQSIDTNNRAITGFVAPAAGVHRIIAVNNISSSGRDLKFKHNDSGSSAVNRLYIRDNTDKTIRPNETAMFWYDHTSSRWRSYNRIG